MATAEKVWRAPGPIAGAFVAGTQNFPDDILILTGPVASGKNGCIAAAVGRAFAAQPPSGDGVKRLKIAIVRATYSRLIAATVPSFLTWFPDGAPGRLVKGSSPITYEIKTPDAHLQVLFVAIDRPDEASRIMGADLSFAVVDEAREVDESVLSALLTRCGRFPALSDGSGGPVFRGLLVTSNKSDTRHWLYRYATEKRPHTHWLDQSGGLEPGAENLSALPGGRAWYERLAATLPADQVGVLVHNKWGLMRDGKIVFTNFSQQAHVSREMLAPVQREPLIGGADIGPTQQPGFIVMQPMPDGSVIVLGELHADGMAAQQFGQACRRFVAQHWPNNDMSVVFADPASLIRTGADGTLPIDAFSAASGWTVKPSPALRMNDRIEAGQSIMSRMVNGQPALRVNPNCVELIAGLATEFVFKEIGTSIGGKIVSDQILKRHPSGDVTDAFLYALAGAGEYASLRGSYNEELKRRRARKNRDVAIAAGVGDDGLEFFDYRTKVRR